LYKKNCQGVVLPTRAAIKSSKKKRGVQEGPLVKMLERQRVQQAAEDVSKKLAGAAADAAKKLVDVSKKAEETAAAAPALSAPEEAQVSLSGSIFNGRFRQR
jgi:hypothetical protein